MLDVAGILFSSTMMLIVILRAVQLDSRMPWFQKLPVRLPKAAGNKLPWRPRG